MAKFPISSTPTKAFTKSTKGNAIDKIKYKKTTIKRTNKKVSNAKPGKK